MRKKLPFILILTGLLSLLAGVLIILNDNPNTLSRVQSNLTRKALTGQPPAQAGNELLIGVLMIAGLGLTASGYYTLRKQKQASAKNSITFDFTKSNQQTLRELVGICLIIGGTSFLN